MLKKKMTLTEYITIVVNKRLNQKGAEIVDFENIDKKDVENLKYTSYQDYKSAQAGNKSHADLVREMIEYSEKEEHSKQYAQAENVLKRKKSVK